METIQYTKETTAMDLGALLDACDDAVVTLVACDTRLVTHRAVMMDRSPVFTAMFQHDTLEANSGEVAIADVEGAVLRQLLSYLYTLRVPQLPDMAAQLLAAADKYGVAGLKVACEQQVAAQLSVETAAAAAVLAVRHSCETLRKDAINFIKDHNYQVMASQGWAEAILNQPKDVIEVSRLLATHQEKTESPTMEAIQYTKETTAMDLDALLDACDDAMVTLVAGDTRLVAHRAVLMYRSPVFTAMFQHDTLEANSGQVAITDVEGAVLRQLLSYLYTLRVPQLPDMAAQLLAAADKYGVADLKVACEQQVAAQLSVETAAAAAVLAVRHSCETLRKDAINFIKDHNYQVMASQGWAVAILNQPKDVIEVSRLLADPPGENSLPAPADRETSTCDTTQQHSGDSGHSGTPASAAPAAAAPRYNPPPYDAAVIISRLWRLPRVEKNRLLGYAADEGAVRDLEALLAAGADVAARHPGRRTALDCAAQHGHVQAVRLLLAWGAPVNARNYWSRTPLHVAAQLGYPDVVRLLLEASADPGVIDVNGWTPLDYATRNKHWHVVKLLSER